MSQTATNQHVEAVLGTIRALMQRIVDRHKGYRATANLKPDDHDTVNVFIDDDRMVSAGKATYRTARFEVCVSRAPSDRPKLQAALSERFSRCLGEMSEVSFEADDTEIPATGERLFAVPAEEHAEAALASANSEG